MNLFLKNCFLLLIVSLVAAVAGAQVKYKASIIPSQINKDEYATLRLEIVNGANIQQIKPPVLKDFNVVSGPNQETGMNTVNGVGNIYMAVSYVLQPKRAGKFIIGESAVVVAGKEYKSGPMKLVVKNESGRTQSGQASPAFSNPFLDPLPAAPKPAETYSDYILKKGENVPEKVSKNMQLRLQTSKTSCYVGEPVVATYKLFTRLKSESKMTKAPSFNGFSVIDMMRPDESEQGVERLNGREYNVYTVRKSQLYPLQDGDIELESATLDNRIQFIKDGAQISGMDDFFDGFGGNPDAIVTQTVSLSNKPVSIHVKPLPEAGKPASFNGAVGNFKITSALEKNNFGSDEAGKLTITVSGNGNLQLITAPEIAWPQGIEAFDAKVQDDIDPMTIPVSGSKTFVIPFTVNTAGEYSIPAVRFSYFDPAKAAYKTDSTRPISFTVTKGSTKPVYDIDTLSQKKPESISKKIFSHREWIIGVIALLIISGLYFWSRSDSKTKVKKQAKEETKKETEEPVNLPLQVVTEKSQNPLYKTEECLNSTDCTQFYTLLNGELKEWLAERFSPDLQAVNAKKITAAFDKAGIDNAVTLELQQLMQEIEWQLYTPFERSDMMSDLYSRAQSVIQTISSYQQPAATQ